MSTTAKILCMDWFSRFQCVGGTCPLTCCANWRIALTDQEIANYIKMEYPFAKEFVSMIDQENKCMKTQDGVCMALTEDGWCRLVRECGEEHLSAVCSTFPRTSKKYGDVVEGTVEIVCPIVAGYLLEPNMIEFEFAEKEVNKPLQEIDYQIYDSLSLARTYLIETIQAYPCQYVHGKLYMILKVLDEIKKCFQQNQLSLTKTSEILRKYDSDKIRNSIFAECEALARKYETKGQLVQRLLMYLGDVLRKNIFLKLKSCEKELEQDLDLWLSDSKIFAENIEKFTEYQQMAYPFMADNFLVYVIFINWISMDSEQFGRVFTAKILEWILIQIIAMSVWRKSGKVSKEEYEVIIATIDRIISHSSKANKEMADFMQAIGESDVGIMVMGWI